MIDSKKISKRGQIGLNDIPRVAVLIILAILTLSFGALIMNSVEDIALKTGTNTITNESDTATFNVNFSLGNDRIDSATYVLSSSTEVIAAANFTLDAAAGRVNLTNSSGSGLFNTASTLVVNSTYDHTTDILSADVNVTRDGKLTVLNISTLIPTAGTVLGAALIIGILLAAFAFGRFGFTLKR